MLSMRTSTRTGLIAGILGLLLIIFGSVWITAVFSSFEKIPSDWDQIDDLQGTFTFVDQEFTDRLQNNATIGQLLAAPGGQNPLEDPAVRDILANPAVGQLVSNPDILAMLQDPAALQSLANPTLTELLSNPQVLELLQDPVIAAALGDPAAMLQLANHPVAGPLLGPLLADPAVSALLQDPAFLSFLQSGLLITLASQPEIMGLLQDPALGAVLANPAVQALLADPEAMSLVLDSRTQKVIANPADLPMVTVPVLLHRERRATGTDGDRIFINEQVSTLDPTTGEDVQGFPRTDVDLIVDRKSKEYLPGTEGGRSGFWGLPFHVDKDRSYLSWVTAAQRPLEAAYKGTEELLGLETYVFTVEVTNFSLGEDDPLGLPLVLDALITTWNEPKTGSSVKIEDYDAVYAVDPAGNRYPRFVADVNHTEETIEDLVDEAKDNRRLIVWFGTYMPWASIGLGILLTVAGGAVWGLGGTRGKSEG